MITFQEIKNNNDLKPFIFEGWKITEPHQNERINDKGEQVSKFYQGRSFKSLGRYEKDYSTVERIFRAVLGFFTILLTGGFAAFSKNVCNLFASKKIVVLADSTEEEEREEEEDRIGDIKDMKNEIISLTIESTRIPDTKDTGLGDLYRCHIVNDGETTPIVQNLHKREIIDISRWLEKNRVFIS